jgi:hypothetical protein
MAAGVVGIMAGITVIGIIAVWPMPVGVMVLPDMRASLDTAASAGMAVEAIASDTASTPSRGSTGRCVGSFGTTRGGFEFDEPRANLADGKAVVLPEIGVVLQ